jgi:hypothetical protein
MQKANVTSIYVPVLRKNRLIKRSNIANDTEEGGY